MRPELRYSSAVIQLQPQRHTYQQVKGWRANSAVHPYITCHKLLLLLFIMRSSDRYKATSPLDIELVIGRQLTITAIATLKRILKYGKRKKTEFEKCWPIKSRIFLHTCYTYYPREHGIYMLLLLDLFAVLLVAL